jgi:hypothetical protein
MEPATFFSPDYATARERFRAAARAAGATLDELALAARGPRGEALTIDIARLGAREAARVLVHTSGVHGVEAFAGSAVQLAALAAPPPLPADGALVLVHVLNPYGMAWLRRANESNVDLNRNFLGPGERYAGAPALYARLDPLLNPPTPPASDHFLPRLVLFALRHGMKALRQAIAQGQYDYPRGLFYGGAALAAGPALYLDWLRRHLGEARYVFALDLHTGLGPRGEQTLILEPGVAATPAAALARALGARLLDPAAGGAAYTIRGGMGSALPRALPAARLDFVLQEIGTCSPLRVIRALREENCWHLHGGGTLEHPAKRALLEALCPQSPRWRARALALGTGLLRAAARFAFGPRP